MADAIRRHLETILDKGNPPADEYDRPQWRGLVLEMPIPGDRHENVRDRQQSNSVHEGISSVLNCRHWLF